MESIELDATSFDKHTMSVPSPCPFRCVILLSIGTFEWRHVGLVRCSTVNSEAASGKPWRPRCSQTNLIYFQNLGGGKELESHERLPHVVWQWSLERLQTGSRMVLQIVMESLISALSSDLFEGSLFSYSLS